MNEEPSVNQTGLPADNDSPEANGRNVSGKTSERERLSSIRPQLVGWTALIGAVAAFGLAGIYWISSDRVAGVVLVAGVIQSIVALMSFMNWKQVYRSGDYYHVSGLFKSEAIPLTDVCLVVSSRGLLWDGVEIHFSRLTRFGWSVSYVPLIAAADTFNHNLIHRGNRSPEPS